MGNIKSLDYNMHDFMTTTKENLLRYIRLIILVLAFILLWISFSNFYYDHFGQSKEIGTVSINSYSATLYEGNLDDAKQFQRLIDKENSAAYSQINGIPYIADHSYQGFDETENNEILYISINDVTTSYKKYEEHFSSQRKEWIADDGTDIYQITNCDLITQTCIGDNLLWILWKKV